MGKQEQQTLDYVGTERNGVYRPTITLENLDTTKVDKSNIDNDGYCDFLRIPLTPQADEILSYQQMFCYLVDKVVCGFNDVFPQSENLFLVVDDSEGERQYYVGTDIQVENWNGVNTETSIEKIHPSDEEKAAVELALLKLTDSDEYLRKYTRYQIAQLPQIINKFGFYNDCVDSHGDYRSTWITKDLQRVTLCYIENVKDSHSEIQMKQIGA